MLECEGQACMCASSDSAAHDACALTNFRFARACACACARACVRACVCAAHQRQPWGRCSQHVMKRDSRPGNSMRVQKGRTRNEITSRYMNSTSSFPPPTILVRTPFLSPPPTSRRVPCLPRALSLHSLVSSQDTIRTSFIAANDRESTPPPPPRGLRGRVVEIDGSAYDCGAYRGREKEGSGAKPQARVKG